MSKGLSFARRQRLYSCRRRPFTRRLYLQSESDRCRGDCSLRHFTQIRFRPKLLVRARVPKAYLL